MAGHQAQGLGEGGTAGGELHQAGNHGKVQGTGIHLPHVHPLGGNAQVSAHAVFQLQHAARVLPEEGELVKLGAHGAFQPAHAVAVHQGNPGTQAVHDVFPEHGDALAHGGGLRGYIVRAAGDGHVLPLSGKGAHAVQHGHGLVPDDLHGLPDLELFHVFRQVAGGHALVDVLAAGQLAELFNARLHVVARDAFAGVNGGKVHLVLHPFVSFNHAVRNIQPQILLGLHHGDPEFAFQDDAALCGPDGFHGGGGVPFSQDIGNHAHIKMCVCGGYQKR